MKRQVLWLALFCLLLSGNSCSKNEPIPTAGFAFSGNNGFHSPCQVLFENNSVNAFSFQWEFGDDSVSYIKQPAHWFMKPGTYQVKLRSYTESGKEWASVVKPVTILPPANNAE